MPKRRPPKKLPITPLRKRIVEPILPTYAGKNLPHSARSRRTGVAYKNMEKIGSKPLSPFEELYRHMVKNEGTRPAAMVKAVLSKADHLEVPVDRLKVLPWKPVERKLYEAHLARLANAPRARRPNPSA